MDLQNPLMAMEAMGASHLTDGPETVDRRCRHLRRAELGGFDVEEQIFHCSWIDVPSVLAEEPWMNRDDRQSSAGEHREETFPEIADTERDDEEADDLGHRTGGEEHSDQHEADANETEARSYVFWLQHPVTKGEVEDGEHTCIDQQHETPTPDSSRARRADLRLEIEHSTLGTKESLEDDRSICEDAKQIQEAEHRQTTGDRQEQASQAHELPCTMSHMAVSVPCMVPLKSEVQVGDRCAP